MQHPPLELIKGHATGEGTQRFVGRGVKPSPEAIRIAKGHMRPFGAEPLWLSSLGMGSYLGETNKETDTLVTQAVVRSVESGAINVIDTAINYRHQKAERAIGKALKQLTTNGVHREELFICSKNGYLAPDMDSGLSPRDYIQREIIDSGAATPSDIANGSHCMSSGYLNHQLDCSRANLGIETLDLMYLHNAAEAQIPAVGRTVFMERLKEAFTFYEQARQENRIRFYGLASWDCFRSEPIEASTYLNLETIVQLAEEVGGSGHGFRFVQVPFNLVFTEAGTLLSQTLSDSDHTSEKITFLEAALRLRIGVFTSVPLLQGQLLGQNLPSFEEMNSPAQSCLQFVRSHPGVLAPLVGHKHSAHVEENIKVAIVSPIATEQLGQILAAL